MLKDRLSLYRSLEKARGRPLIAYVTSMRDGCEGQISADAVGEIQSQLQALPAGTKALDLLLVSQGGDPTVAWQIVSSIRARCEQFAVLVPHAAFSAATLIVLGADEIVMHPYSNLGPTDPQITVRRSDPDADVQFGSEDLAAYLKFVKDNVSGKGEEILAEAFHKFCLDAGSIGIGIAARGSQLSLSMGEKLLQLHMKGEAKSKAKDIAQKLTKEFFHHGYPVNRSEAREIGLKVTKSNGNGEVDELMWRIWLSMVSDLKIREPFNLLSLVKANPACAGLFAPVPVANLPANLPDELVQPLAKELLAHCAITEIPSTPFQNIHVIVESPRLASAFVTHGAIFASRLPDLSFSILDVIERQGWETMYSATEVSSRFAM